MKNRWLLTLALLFSISLMACQPIQAPVEEQSAPQGLRPDAPSYAVHGPFAVGYKRLVIDENTEHPLEVSLWYPAFNPTGRKEEITYTSADGSTASYGHAILDAEIDGSAGPYPPVVFSHGFSATPLGYSPLVEHYASYGFIVLAPQHTEQFDPALGDLWKSSIDRPPDVTQTLDYAEALTAPAGEWSGLIDMEQVAVVGHSYGGYTALAVAGAQYDMAAHHARCAQVAPEDPRAVLCTALLPKEAEMAARAGLDPTPTALWPSFGDPRVKVIIPMAGDAYLFNEAGLSKITVPMMVLGGSADTGTPYDWGAKLSYDHVTSAQKALVTFVGAEHMIFTSLCENDEPGMTPAHPAYAFFCLDPVWDRERALDLGNHFATAFLLYTLKGDQAAHAALLPEAVNFPGIEYRTTLH